MFHTIEEALIDLKSGKVIIVVDDEDRENEGDFVALSEKITPETINFMINHGRGLVCTSITNSLAKELHLPLMTDENTDPFGTAFTISIDHQKTTTGISAHERAMTIQALTNGAVAADFKRPGHVFPLIAKDNGVLVRPGHTEASVDLARLAGAFPSGVICEITKEDGTMARVPALKKIAEKFGLKMITIKDLIEYRKRNDLVIKREVATDLPTKYGMYRMIGYSNILDKKEHLALVKGDIKASTPVLTRIHSECLTGDIFHSHRCDCGPQLNRALEMMEERGSGILLYMRQEGRGIGLINKLRAYELQDDGLDTVEANEALGFPDDLREYFISAQILQDLGISEIELLTNNPAKMKAMEKYDITVTKRIALETGRTAKNSSYLLTKQEKMGHLLTVEGIE